MITSRDCVLGIDCGGTHTDAVLLHGGRLLARAKVPTDHASLAHSIAGVLDALEAEMGAGGKEAGKSCLQGVQRITLGTTLLVNACVQGRLDRVGLALSAGPGIAPQRFALGDACLVVPGGLDHRGVEVTPLELAPLQDQCRRWQNEGIAAFACVGKFSPRNPEHERRMGQTVMDTVPGAVPSLGHRVAGELDFPRRIATAYYNSAARRLHNAFLDACEAELAARGCLAPICLLKADGGSLPLARSRPLPVQAMLSGPAASVMGLMALREDIGDRITLLLDMGGTTTDIALLVNGVPVLDRDGMRLNGRRTLVRTLATSSIGIGGDSLIAVSGGGETLAVTTGPLREGPACAFGGTRATLLDALNVLNAADGLDECAGRVEASRRALDDLAAVACCSPQTLALLAWESACSAIAGAAQALVDDINARPIYTLRELVSHTDVRPQRICLVGGPAPCVRKRLAQGLGQDVESVPMADVANAVGAALSRPSEVLEVYADTGKGNLLAPARDIEEKLPPRASLSYVEERALALLKEDMAREGGASWPLEVTRKDVFATLSDSGCGHRDMRVTCQVVPGLTARFRAD